MPRLAVARRPGSKLFLPSVRAFSMSMVPQMRSSVAPRGSSTSGTLISSVSNLPPLCRVARASGPITRESSGSELNMSPLTVVMSGSKSDSERTTVDLPVPRSPVIKTPPMRGSTIFSNSARFISSWPAMRVNGKQSSSSSTSTVFTVASSFGTSISIEATATHRPPVLLPLLYLLVRLLLRLTYFLLRVTVARARLCLGLVEGWARELAAAIAAVAAELAKARVAIGSASCTE
mmetsp:Transcript_13424/g.48847  ORF Transcript_13424/g.48847 Transcript_13424/m.48847 type:complete len:234 (-) Transcript_13424:207-908(-)